VGALKSHLEWATGSGVLDDEDGSSGNEGFLSPAPCENLDAPPPLVGKRSKSLFDCPPKQKLEKRDGWRLPPCRGLSVRAVSGHILVFSSALVPV
jgi:hypothetical protein